MTETVVDGPLTATIREAWILKEDRRLSGQWPEWTDKPTIHAIVIETISVEEPHRRQGHCRRFLDMVLADVRFEMVVVEGVGNKALVAFLFRDGWECPNVTVGDWFKAGGGAR